jgi:hypothetical protein
MNNSAYFILEAMGALKLNGYHTILLKRSRFILNIPSGYNDQAFYNYLGFQTFNSRTLDKLIRKDIARLSLEIMDIQKRSVLTIFKK